MSRAGLDVVGLFVDAGRRMYGEHVSQLEHALQCAMHARRDRAADEIVLAALLHDIGHLLEPTGDTPHHHHGIAAAQVLRAVAPSRVAWLVEHHVVAKRYLVTIDTRYRELLSPVSRTSLTLQGAELAVDEVAQLEAHAWFGDAVRLRRWDDDAKQPELVCEPLIAYRSLLETCLGPQRWVEKTGIDR